MWQQRLFTRLLQDVVRRGQSFHVSAQCFTDSTAARRLVGAPEGGWQVDSRVYGGCGCCCGHFQRHVLHRLAVAQVAVLVELRTNLCLSSL